MVSKSSLQNKKIKTNRQTIINFNFFLYNFFFVLNKFQNAFNLKFFFLFKEAVAKQLSNK